MTRKSKKQDATQDVELVVTQDAPTLPAPRDDNGFELDAWGLPVCGPVRAARLAERGLPDPHDEPEAWANTLGEPVDLTGDEGGLNDANTGGETGLQGAGAGALAGDQTGNEGATS